MIKVKNLAVVPTAKEVQMLQLLSDGKTHEQIAEDMFLAKRTIDGYVAIMFKKFSVKNACELVTIALRNDWIN